MWCLGVYFPPPHYIDNLFDSSALASASGGTGLGSDHLQGRGLGTHASINLNTCMNDGMNFSVKVSPSVSSASEFLFDSFSSSASFASSFFCVAIEYSRPVLLSSIEDPLPYVL